MSETHDVETGAATLTAARGLDHHHFWVFPRLGRRRQRRTAGLSAKLLPELQQLAGDLGIAGTAKLRKSQLIEAIQAAQSGQLRPATSSAPGASSSGSGRRRAGRNGANGSARAAALRPRTGALERQPLPQRRERRRLERPSDDSGRAYRRRRPAGAPASGQQRDCGDRQRHRNPRRPRRRSAVSARPARSWRPGIAPGRPEQPQPGNQNRWQPEQPGQPGQPGNQHQCQRTTSGQNDGQGDDDEFGGNRRPAWPVPRAQPRPWQQRQP